MQLVKFFEEENIFDPMHILIELISTLQVLNFINILGHAMGYQFKLTKEEALTRLREIAAHKMRK